MRQLNPFNPHAGYTPAPTDPVAVEVARRAGLLMWRAVPYFGQRYGERGWRFTVSDGGWLTTLASRSPEVRRAQVEWLARVLSPRGMPSWLLELQLRATRRVGRRLGWAGAEALVEVEGELAEQRRRVLADEAFAAADTLFARSADAGRLARGTGRLIAAAHVDAAIGLCPSAANVVGWLADGARFGASWRTAVEETSAFVTTEVARRGRS